LVPSGISHFFQFELKRYYSATAVSAAAVSTAAVSAAALSTTAVESVSAAGAAFF
jgi:hypothetical protein